MNLEDALKKMKEYGATKSTSLLDEVIEAMKGGPGSGNWGHAGVEGQRGGSASGGGHARVGITQDMDVNDKLNALSDYAEGRQAEREGRTRESKPKKETAKPSASHIFGEIDPDSLVPGSDDMDDKELADKWKQIDDFDLPSEWNINNNKVTVKERLEYWRDKNKGASNRSSAERESLVNAAKDVAIDSYIRTNGKEMTAKFDGKDIVTKEPFQSGSTIIYSSKLNGAVIK